MTRPCGADGDFSRMCQNGKERPQQMTRTFRRVRMAISSLRLVPHTLIMLSMNNIDTLKADLAHSAEVLNMDEPRTIGDFVILFITFMTFTPEFRNVFYLRAGRKAWIVRWMCPSLPCLDIVSPKIGAGLFIQHGEGTFISANSIGENCHIGRQVLVGYNKLDRPTIGNNVRIYPGAKIIGNITIGDNATVGLNTVVIDDVPPNVTVFGVPGRVTWKVNPGATSS